MSQVFIHRYSGILSAYGLALADVVHEAQEPCAKEYGGLMYIIMDSVLSCTCFQTAATFDYIDARLDALTEQCIDVLEKQGFNRFLQ
jgi:5-oxoprolinase (ATP-hydrolysing)